jgi:hypothetical protein
VALPQIRARALLSGLASFAPGVHKFTNRGSGGSGSARYCYSVWLRHLVRARQAGLTTNPACVAELGPGDSLGIGLSALLSGSDRYIALDVKSHANPERNLAVFDELVLLFGARTPIPDDLAFPLVQPKLTDYRFPDHILTSDRLAVALAEPRLAQIRAAIVGDPSAITLAYKAPWNDPGVIESACVDFLVSQAVLEHVEDVEATYKAMRTWMKRGASMSHSVDFSCHGLTRDWNGHWTLGDLTWRVVHGTRRYLINREPLSTHLAMLAKYGFHPVRIERRRAEISNAFQPAPRFRTLSDEDASTQGAFVQATVP